MVGLRDSHLLLIILTLHSEESAAASLPGVSPLFGFSFEAHLLEGIYTLAVLLLLLLCLLSFGSFGGFQMSDGTLQLYFDQ